MAPGYTRPILLSVYIFPPFPPLLRITFQSSPRRIGISTMYSGHVALQASDSMCADHVGRNWPNIDQLINVSQIDKLFKIS